ncbi:MAG: UDP-N-acetylmuramate--L-alanine ligase [Candidatus Zixiibacteriota bacterium]|nr:MAG: UDP-N-acetylmuramate--L-alanine ligase [candidate division Zixibacteria bacterium]
MFGKVKKLYFVGIGGAGMSGIAEILHNLGFEIKGSDNTPSEITQYLDGLGLTIFDEHRSENIRDVDVVVISSAVGEDNPEVVEARRQGVPVIKRAEMLGELMRLKFSIGVSGTHGKTTTTSMIGKILQHGKYHPTLIVGGVVAELGTGAALGSGDYLVAEADEYDKSFLSMFPSLAVVTNLEPDHLDCYDDMDDLIESFITYMNRVPFYGSVIISADDMNLSRIRSRIARPYQTFGFEAESDFRATDVSMESSRTVFAVHHRGDLLGEIIIKVPGMFNVANALAAVATCRELDVPFETIADGLLTFTGVSRRFEIIGEANDIVVVDDYAHHPSEIKATLEAAQSLYQRRVIVIYQPHLYSRTRDFKSDFARALSVADVCILTDIYPAREEPIEGISSAVIAQEASALGLGRFEYVGAKENAIEKIVSVTQPGDLVITMGAGSITLIKNKILDALR